MGEDEGGLYNYLKRKDNESTKSAKTSGDDCLSDRHKCK